MQASTAMGVTSLAAAAGAADTALFVITRPALFRTKPRRALANVAALAAWSALALRSRSEAGGRPRAVTQVLAVSLFATNAAVLAAHLANGIARPRVFVGPALSAVALGDVLRRR